MKWTILGADGFIGSALSKYFSEKGHDVTPAGRNFDYCQPRDLGHVIFAIGLTSDFRTDPLGTVEAHVCAFKKLLAENNFDSVLYLSSTRVYTNSTSTNEFTPLMVTPHNASDLYNISKLMGESLCLAISEKPARIVRLSNIVGQGSAGDFLSGLVQQAYDNGQVQLATTMNSEKDYLFIDRLGPIIESIARTGRQRIYNVASGTNTTNEQIIRILQQRTNCVAQTAADAVEWSFNPIDIQLIKDEFSFTAPRFEDEFLAMLSVIQARIERSSS